MAALPKIGGDYGDGFANSIVVRGVPINVLHPGETFWVDENAGRTGRGTFRAPDTTIDTAINRCVAGRGDIIMVKPGHVENVGTTNYFDLDIDSVAIVGLGRGTDQATIQFQTSADSAYCDIAGDNCAIISMRITNTIDDLDYGFRIAANNSYFTMANNYVYAAATSGFETMIQMGGSCFGFQFINNDVMIGGDDDGASLVEATSSWKDMLVIGNRIIMDATAAIFDLDAQAATGSIIFQNNFMANYNATVGLCVAINAATPANFIDERYASSKNDVVPASDLSASFVINNFGTDAVATAGIRWPKTTSTWP